jgi:hypothetical protein
MVPVTFQESLLVVSLVSKGGDAPRMKHFIARMNLAKEVME